MRGPLRVLACADLDIVERLEVVFAGMDPFILCGRASSGGELLAQFRARRPDLVVIGGDIDGCHGVRIARVLARDGFGQTEQHPPTPVLLLVDRGAQDEARDELEARVVEAHVLAGNWRDRSDDTSAALLRTTLRLMASRILPSEPEESSSVRPHLAGIARSDFEAIILIGSAGTPHMLPDLLGSRPPTAIPLVVAVHHNPRMSEAFCTWVGELVGLDPHALPDHARALDLQPLHVARAIVQGGDAGLEPDLAAVVDRVVARERRVLVGVASGMGLTALDALRRVRNCGGVVVALDPSTCSQPAMSSSVVEAGLADQVVSVDELAWMLEHVGEREAVPESDARQVRLAAAI